MDHRRKKALARIGSEKIDPEIGVDFRINGIDKYIDQKEGWHEHIHGSVQFKKGVGKRTELFKNGKANYQRKKGLHYSE